VVVPPPCVSLRTKNVGERREFQELHIAICGLPLQKNILTLGMKRIVANGRYFHVELHEAAADFLEVIVWFLGYKTFADQENEERGTQALQSVPLPHLSMVLERIAKVLVTIAHRQDFALLDQANEDVLVLSSHSPENAGLVQLQPSAVSANLSPFVVAGIKQDGVNGLNVLRELAFPSEQIVFAMQLRMQQQFAKMCFLWAH